MPIELRLDDARWTALDLPTLADAAFGAVCAASGLDPARCEVAILACGDAAIARLNADFRGNAAATNVLSWPAEDLAATLPGAPPRRPEADFSGAIALGDIAIAWDTCLREAEAAGKPMSDHVAHLVVHGLLHLLGYDHIDDRDAAVMEGLEVEILGRLGLDDPYREANGA